MSSMVVKEELKAAETAAAAATKVAAAAESKLAKLEADLKAATQKAEQLEQKATSVKADLLKAKKQTSLLEREVSQVKASFKTAENEALKLRQRAEEAEMKLQEIHEHHTGAWLPHWLEETAGKSFSQAGLILANVSSTTQTAMIRGADVAMLTWRTRVVPMTLHVAEIAKIKGSEFAAFASKRLEEKNITLPPALKNAFTTLQDAVNKAKSSPIAAQAQSYAISAKNTVAKHGSIVVSELESLLIQAAGVHPSLAKLTQKPVASFIVYVLLFAPVVAIGMPLLASRRGRSAAARASSSQRKQATSASQGATSSRKTQSTSSNGGKKLKKY